MNSRLYLGDDNKKYISTKEASSLTGYSRDYIGQLVRSNKIDSQKIGRTWYVSEEAILNYKIFSNQLGLVPDVAPEKIQSENFIQNPVVIPVPSVKLPAPSVSGEKLKKNLKRKKYFYQLLVFS